MMRPIRAACCAAFFLTVCVAFSQNPHDGYAFWLPNGELNARDSASVKEFKYTKSGSTATFTVPLRRTRFDVPKGDLVIIRLSPPIKAAATVAVSVNEKRAEDWTILKTSRGSGADLYLIPRQLFEGKREVNISLTGDTGAPTYRFYLTDDRDKLGGIPDGALVPAKATGAAAIAYLTGLRELFAHNFREARRSFEFSEQANGERASKGARLARQMRRCSGAMQKYMELSRARIAPGMAGKKRANDFYKLGLYCAVNGFWDAAMISFKSATDNDPRNPDYWYMYGDALSYVTSDLDRRMETIYPVYRKAADLYPQEGRNDYRTYIGFYKKLRLRDGDGKEFVQEMTPEQIDYIRKAWEWCSAIMEASSRGAIRMVNTYVEHDREFDSREVNDPKPFEGQFKEGEIDTWMKFTGWGASDAMGHDCGPNRSAFVNIGIREWEVLYHEWNHTLDWLVISSEEGIGVPETHASDWCGFQPISSMGMGHHSCNRYYMTPGTYRAIKGSAPVTTPYVGEWRITTEAENLGDGAATEETFNRLRAGLSQESEIDAIQLDWGRIVQAKEGYVDLKSAYPDAGQNATSFAQAYIYSPTEQKVRMWLGADDNVRMWLNDRLVHKGVYWSVALWEEAREKDQICTGQVLRKGWNRVWVRIANLARPGKGDYDDAWGFSVRLTDYQNRPLEGVKWQAEMPDGFSLPLTPPINAASPKTYRWETVKDDYTTDLPRLTLADLRAITGYSNLTMDDNIHFQTPSSATSSIASKEDQTLNNHLNWYFSPKEMVAVVRYQRGDKQRDLVFLRPEIYEAFMTLAGVTPEAKAQKITRHADQVIGYVTVPRGDSPNGRIVLALDTYLGPKLPIDEEDLLDISSLR